MANRHLELGVFAPTIGCMPPAASRLVYGGKVNLRPVISHTVPLREGLRAFALIEQGEAAKVLVTP